MSALQRALADARVRNFRGVEGQVPGSIDFDDPVERTAIVLYRLKSDTSASATSMVNSPDGQVALARTWALFTDEDRQLYRRRACALLEVGLAGREFRSRPEDNVA